MTLFIPLCLESYDKYYFNILRMITLLYHMYIHNEIYQIAYNKVPKCINYYQFIELTTRNWCGYITL